MEINGDSAAFPSLLFHCDWVVHPVMDRASAKTIVALFDEYQRLLDLMAATPGANPTEVNMDFLEALDPIMNMSTFREELGRYLQAETLDARISVLNDDWSNFMGYYAAIIEDCLQRCKTSGLKATDEVVLRVANITLEHLAAAPTWSLNGTGNPNLQALRVAVNDSIK